MVVPLAISGRRRASGSLQHGGGAAPGLWSAFRKGLAGGLKGVGFGYAFFLHFNNKCVYIYTYICDSDDNRLWMFVFFSSLSG